jgi:thymidylate synthase ThyX
MSPLITAEIVVDSVNSANDRLTTFKLRYPRIIHQQLLMHRAFSRSCSSSRAIPTQTLINELMKSPPVFASLKRNQSGMQPGDVLGEDEEIDARQVIEEHKNFSILCALQLARMGVHKQWANRLLEPHACISVVLTATNHPGALPNFFGVRCAKDAQDEIDILAHEMHSKWLVSTPTVLKDGEWHLPFVTPEERKTLSMEDLLKVSSARCARTSYNKHDRSDPVVSEDLALAGKLASSRHSNPFEHQAQAMSQSSEGGLCGNFIKGWFQNRKLLEQQGVL